MPLVIEPSAQNERAGEKSREPRVMAGERERELNGVAGGDGYGESRGEQEGSDCDSHLWLRRF